MAYTKLQYNWDEFVAVMEYYIADGENKDAMSLQQGLANCMEQMNEQMHS